MRKILFALFIICLSGCHDMIDDTTIIKGHLIEGSSKKSLSDVKVTLYDNSKIYAIAFSDEEGMFSLTTPSLEKNRDYYLSFYWSMEYPAKTITICNSPAVFDVGDFVVYDESNPYDYKVFTFDGHSFMIHKTLSGTFTYNEAKSKCDNLRDGYRDWMLPPADLMDVIADDEFAAKQIAEEGWYWSSWVTHNLINNLDYYSIINIMMNDGGYATDPNSKLKVLPVRLIN